jgi:hypothetical protein
MVCALGPFVCPCLGTLPGWFWIHLEAAAIPLVAQRVIRRPCFQGHGAVALTMNFHPRSGLLDVSLASVVGAGEHADDLVTDLPGFSVEGEQDAGSDAIVHANECEQDVLGASVVMPKSLRLTLGLCEHLLRTGREGDLAGGYLLAGADDPDDLSAHTFDGYVQAFENPSGQSLLLAEKPEQDVLGADAFVLERPRLILGEGDRLACWLY